MLGMVVRAKPVVDGIVVPITTTELDGDTSETTTETARATVTVKPATNSLAQLTSYPESRKLQGLLRYVVPEYHRSSFIALALWNVSAQNEEEASKLVSQYLHEHQLDDPDAEGGCAPHFNYDYNAYRFPAILIRGTCSVSICSPAENIETQFRTPGRCVPERQNAINVLQFVEEPERDKEPSASGADSDESLVQEPVGKWQFKLVFTPQECVCAAK